MATFAQMITEATRRLKAAGVADARREARQLMAVAADMTTTQLIVAEHDQVAGDAVALFAAMVNKREERVPFQHITGHASFHGHTFICDARALVPRGDSEVVVEAALDRLPRGRGVRVADLGTGSGCLLIAILKARGGVTGEGVDADGNAASLAMENIKRHELTKRAKVSVMDWSKWQGWEDMDLILSNPPYIARRVIDELEPEVRLHDPVTALDGGEDGLDAYREIVTLAAARMKPGAWLVLEIGFDQDEAVRSLLKEGNFTEIGGQKDFSGNDRVVYGRKTAAD